MINPNIVFTGHGKSEHLMKMLGMTNEEYLAFYNRQSNAHYRVLKAEQNLVELRKKNELRLIAAELELKKARDEYFLSFEVRSP